MKNSYISVSTAIICIGRKVININFMPSHFAKFPHSAKKHAVDLDDDTTLPLVDKKQTTSVVVTIT